MGIHGNDEIVRFCTETTRGELPGAPSWQTVDLHGAGFRGNEAREAHESFRSSTFPHLTQVIKTAKNASPSLVTPIFPLTAQAFLEPGYKRTSGVLDSRTFQHKKGSIEEVGYLGCVVNSMRIPFGANSDPVLVTQEMMALSYDDTVTGITAGAYPGSTTDLTPFMGHKTVVTIGGVDYDNLEGVIICENNLVVPGVGTTGFPIAIKDGTQRWGIELRESQEGSDRLDSLRGDSTVAVVITIKTGAGTEAVSFTMAEVHILEATEDAAEIGDDIQVPLVGVAEKPSEADPVVVAYTTT